MRAEILIRHEISCEGAGSAAALGAEIYSTSREAVASKIAPATGLDPLIDLIEKYKARMAIYNASPDNLTDQE